MHSRARGHIICIICKFTHFFHIVCIHCFFLIEMPVIQVVMILKSFLTDSVNRYTRNMLHYC